MTEARLGLDFIQLHLDTSVPLSLNPILIRFSLPWFMRNHSVWL